MRDGPGLLFSSREAPPVVTPTRRWLSLTGAPAESNVSRSHQVRCCTRTPSESAALPYGVATEGRVQTELRIGTQTSPVWAARACQIDWARSGEGHLR